MAVRLARWLAIVGIVCFPFSQFSTHLFFTRCLPTARIRFTIFIFLSSPDFPTVKHTWVTPYALPAVARAFFLAAAYSWPLAAPGLNFLRFSRALEKKNNTFIEVFSEPFIEAFRSRFQCFHTFVARRGQRSRRAKVARSSGPPDSSYARAM